MPLVWSDPQPPTEGVSYYNHVITKTPLGEIRLEWKSWKDYDPPTAQMPWEEFVVGNNLSDAKVQVQAAWDRKSREIMALSSIDDAMVERAAKAMRQTDSYVRETPWEKTHPRNREEWRNYARTALRAALEEQP